MSAAVVSVPAARAPAAGAVMAQSRRENFPVALRLLGRRNRRHLLAIYGFARLADDIGDESPGDRQELLDWLEHELTGVFAGRTPEHPVMRALAPTVRDCRLAPDPFERLIEANRRDQRVTRYATFEELLGYCRLSAAPVGELVLHVFGAATPERLAWSERVCAGLQVTEHLQDVAEDYARGRVYLPADDLARFGAADVQLGASTAGPAVRALVAHEVVRGRELLAAGAPLAASLSGRPRLAVAAFAAGGHAALDAIEAADHDVLAHRARPTRAGLLRRLAAVLREGRP